MSDLDRYLPLHAHQLWLAAGILLAAAETVTGGFIVLWFGVGCVAAAAAAWLGASFDVQLVVFAASSLLLFASSRTVFRRLLSRKGRVTADHVAGKLGLVVEVVEEIGPGARPGAVRLGGEVWTALARGVRVPVGEQVVVEAVDGLCLQVRPVTPNEKGESR